jgi:hypothetical protein
MVMRMKNRRNANGEIWCSRCKTYHPEFTVNEDGNEVPTFSTSTKNEYQAWCKTSASIYNVEQQRIRRAMQSQQDNPNELVRREMIARDEFKSLTKVTEWHGHEMHVDLQDIENMFSEYNYQCPICGSTYLNIAHNVTLECGGKTEQGNLLPLCNLHKIAKGHHTIQSWASNQGILLDVKTSNVHTSNLGCNVN